jgi:Calcineurin-like phosphoesterase
LQDVDEVLVAGDLHGNLDNFRKILKAADLANHPRRHLVLQEVIHGPWTYPSGSDRSHQLLELVAALKVQSPGQFHFLPGNHELSQFTDRPIGKLSETGDRLNLNELFRQGVALAHGEHFEAIYAAMGELIAAAPLALHTPNRVFFSHSLPSFGNLPEFSPRALEHSPSLPADLAVGGTVYSLLWGRDTRAETVSAFLRLVDADFLITGHMPCDQGFQMPSERHLIVDSQASPAACALVPTTRPLEAGELGRFVTLL